MASISCLCFSLNRLVRNAYTFTGPPCFQQAFSSEAAAVERGLHIQLGDTGAKTESQLGGQQLEAAKRLRHLLSTNR